ncbi:hypothetical protein [Massilibacteroides sp.]|uniref:hypothetical protein n=1 Tax=Massilibacteroides sp. TaxID=2034766 RepID=UPI00261E79A5|nr:hypothetical protein [Massilibacteroides sp.]MDD4515411.1 hypothetical protein [Massilibacteroides sp.]
MYTKIIEILFYVVTAIFLLLWVATLAAPEEHLAKLQKFTKYAKYFMAALFVLLIIALAMDELLFKNVQMHTYF